MLDQRHRSQREGRSLRSCHSLATLGIAYPDVAVVNSLPSQDVKSYGANPTISCPSSPSTHSQSPPAAAFTTQISVVPCSMQKKHIGSNFSSSTSPVTQWPDCDPLDVSEVSPPKTKSADKNLCRGCCSTWRWYAAPSTMVAWSCQTW